ANSTRRDCGRCDYRPWVRHQYRAFAPDGKSLPALPAARSFAMATGGRSRPRCEGRRIAQWLRSELKQSSCMVMAGRVRVGRRDVARDAAARGICPRRRAASPGGGTFVRRRIVRCSDGVVLCVSGFTAHDVPASGQVKVQWLATRASTCSDQFGGRVTELSPCCAPWNSRRELRLCLRLLLREPCARIRHG